MANATTVPSPAMPYDTNAGYPCFTGGFAARLSSGALLGHNDTTDALVAQASSFNDHVFLPHATAFAFGLASRQGPLYKKMPLFKHDGGGTWRATQYGLGHWPRSRQVFMGCYGLNLALGPLLTKLQSGRRATPGFWHSGTLDDQLVASAYAKRLHIYESDISGYDQSVTPDLQRALCDCIKAEMTDMASQADLWLFTEGRPVISANWAQADGYTLATTFGGTHSGQRLTAEVGTLICGASLLYALSLITRQTPAEVWRRCMTGEWLLLVQGDDLLIGINQTLSPTDWVEAWAGLGLKCELVQGVRFLMKHRLPDGARPVAGRIVQQTLSNEHEPSGIDWDPILVLGMQSRWGKGPLEPYANLARSLISMTDFSQRTGVTDGPSAVKWLAEPENARRLQLKIARLARDPWLRKLRHDAPYSDGARLELEALEATGLIPPDDDTYAADTLLQTTLQRVRFLPAADRLKISLEAWNVANEGLNDAAAIARLRNLL
jgi:hypothetical protein